MFGLCQRSDQFQRVRGRELTVGRGIFLLRCVNGKLISYRSLVRIVISELIDFI